MTLQRLPIRPQLLSRAWATCSAPKPSLLCRAESTVSQPSAAGPSPTAAPPSQSLESSEDLDYSSHFTPQPSPEQLVSYDPLARARSRTHQLPPNRYRFRSPKYYRGPLHPHQPPPPSDPSSRLFVPGPFSLPRLLQTYNTTLSHDLMVLGYTHTPPGTQVPPPPQRLRSWDDSSPYHKNRPLRGPRGGPHLSLLPKPITFRNVPQLERIAVSSLVPEAASSSAHLHVAGMVLQAITSQRAKVHMAKSTTTAGHKTKISQKKGRPIAVSAQMTGEQMWHFLSTMVSVVLPRIKEWKGMKARSGDRSGNYGLGLTPETVGGWPEIAINYDAYPPKMIPGIDVFLHTSASTDRDAKLLLSSLGLPFESGGK